MKDFFKKKWVRVIRNILLVLASIALIIVLVVLGLRYKGKRSLMENTRDLPAIDLSVSSDGVVVQQVSDETEDAPRQRKEGENI